MTDSERTSERAPTERDAVEVLGASTRDLSAWRKLWEDDRPFPIRSHRGLLGGLVVAVKKLLRPLVKTPQNDLWERQRIFNLALLEQLQDSPELDRLRWNAQEFKDLSIFLTRFHREGVDEIVAHNDALYAAVDQKLDRYRRESKRLWSELDGALAMAEASGAEAGAQTAGARDLSQAGAAAVRLELEEAGVAAMDRSARYEEALAELPGRGTALVLGCGRGEGLDVLSAAGLEVRGVDVSAAAVEHCRARGLDVERAGAAAALADEPEDGLSAVVALGVVERLEPAEIAAVVSLSWRALEPGGVLLIETPNPLSLTVAASRFWADPTHLRPVHPDGLGALFRAAGFEQVRRLDRRPFADDDRLPEISLAGLNGDARELADRINRLRDRLDGVLFGYRDYAVVGSKPGR